MTNILRFVYRSILEELSYMSFFFKYAVFRKKPVVFLFGAPFHSNLGDQAQTYCIIEWIKNYLSKYQVCITTYTTFSIRRLRIIRKSFRKGDILLCHSGYHITDLYKEKDVYEAVMRTFPNEEIRILPQTIFFKESANERSCAELFNSHGHVTLLCRDRLSFQKAAKIFTKCRLFLYPDIVTSLIGRFPSIQHSQRQGVLFCIRNDKEAFYSKKEIDNLRNNVTKYYETKLSDTTVNLTAEYIASNRYKVLQETLTDMAKYRVTVTDRYHGTIFSLIANTPVIVVNTTDHKLSSGVQWFPESFCNHVFFANTLEEVPSLIEHIMKSPHPDPLPAYFNSKYYGNNLVKTLNLDDYT